jgi:hypothetical protein
MADLLDPANGIFIYKGSSKLLSLDVVSRTVSRSLLTARRCGLV